MRFEQSKVIRKPAVPVQIHFVAGKPMKGFVFVQREGRVIDSLEKREYVPLLTLEGVTLVRADNILRVDVLTYDDFLADEASFPEADHQYLREQKW